MEKHTHKPMTPFDELVTPSHLYMLKVFLPYISPSMQRMFGIFLKFYEFRYTLQSFMGFRPNTSGSSDQLLNDLKTYLNPEDLEKLSQIENMMQAMELIQHMKGDNFSPTDLMKDMMSGEEQDLFRTYEDFFDQTLENTTPKDSSGTTESTNSTP